MQCFIWMHNGEVHSLNYQCHWLPENIWKEKLGAGKNLAHGAMERWSPTLLGQPLTFASGSLTPSHSGPAAWVGKLCGSSLSTHPLPRRKVWFSPPSRGMNPRRVLPTPGRCKRGGSGQSAHSQATELAGPARPRGLQGTLEGRGPVGLALLGAQFSTHFCS